MRVPDWPLNNNIKCILHARLREEVVNLRIRLSEGCPNFFQFFKKNVWKKMLKILFPFFTLTFSILFKNKGEHFFSIFFPKMFFDQLKEKDQIQSAQNVQVGAAPVRIYPSSLYILPIIIKCLHSRC